MVSTTPKSDTELKVTPVTQSSSIKFKGSQELVTIIKPSRGWIWVNLGELWRYRELIYFLVWRDVKVRYKQTLLGAAWAILKPFLSMVILR